MRATHVSILWAWILSFVFAISQNSTLADNPADSPVIGIPTKVFVLEKQFEGRIKKITPEWLVLEPSSGKPTVWINRAHIAYIEQNEASDSGDLSDALGKQAQSEAEKLLKNSFLMASPDGAYSSQHFPRTDFKRFEETWIIQYKGFSTKITKEEITETEALNGIEWKGRLVVQAKSSRMWAAYKGIGGAGEDAEYKWRDWIPLSEVGSWTVIKSRDVGWKTEPKGENFSRLVAPSKEQVKQLPK